MKRTGRARISNVLFEVTPRCNLSCRYCYVPWEAPARPMTAPRAAGYGRAERTLQQLFRSADVGTVTFTGGEPLLAERLPELVLLCRLRGAIVNIISNGTVGTPDDYRQLAGLGVSLFELPVLAAEPAVHDALTGAVGSWDLVMRALEDLKRWGAGIVPAVILTRANSGGLERTLRLIASLGLGRAMINRFNPGGRGLVHARDLTLAPADLRDAFALADDLAPELGLSITSNVGLPHCRVDPRAYRNLRFTSCSADLARRPLALDLDGGLRFCNHSPVVFGNIFEGSVPSALACEYLRRWRTEVPAFCADCERFRRCFGGCRAASEQMGGSLADVDPLALAAGPGGGERSEPRAVRPRELGT